jgi:Domain of unknown function (DUF4272)
MPEEDQEQFVEKIRSADEVARRAVVLYAVMAAGHQESRSELVNWLKRECLRGSVSPKEAEFLEASTPTMQQTVNATWRAEALAPLLWSLGAIPDLLPPIGFCDIQAMRGVLPPLMGSVTQWLSAAQLRSEGEILRANEDVYQIHRKVRDARLNGRPVPDNFHPGVVQERHYALNWLIGYCGQEWDEITTET